MLLCLRVNDFAIISSLEVDLAPGLNVVTGETGAGKSILVNALSLVLGARSRPEVVRTGAQSAEVEALFDISDDPAVRARVDAAGLASDDHELLLRRVIPPSGGRTRAFANGRMATAAQLTSLADGLASISSQHEHHALVDPRTHLEFLDAFAGLLPQRAKVTAAHESLNRITVERDAAIEKSRDRTEREDLLRFQLREIEQLDPQPAELDELVVERDKQRHAERLLSLTASAEETLYSSDGAVCETLSRIASDLSDASSVDPALSSPADQLANAQTQLEDAARELGNYARAISADPDRLAEIEERVVEINRLSRKYGGSVESMLEHAETARKELDALDNADQRITALDAELEKAADDARKHARKLSAQRKKAAKKLSDEISRELASLAMGDARVTVDVAPSQPKPGDLSVDNARLTPLGIDRVEFLIATNRGEDPRPLAKIASGGELSRAMLALKRVLAGVGPCGLYVFDEVDAGIGGAMAEVIGRKLREVSGHHQVICITHLPQIAVFADAHFRVEKSVEDERTVSRITRLDRKEQQEEVARMLGGVKVTDKTRAAAREMLRAASGN